MSGETPGSYIYAYSRPSNWSLKTLRSGLVQQIRHEIAPIRFMFAARHIVSELNLDPSKQVLEIGCGLGLLGEAIQKTTPAYVGIDLARESAASSAEKNLQALQASATAIPFPENTFDALISTDVLEHVPDAEAAVRELARVLRPGGKAFVVIADPSEARFHNVNGHIDRTGSGTDVPFWEQLMETNGLTVIRDRSEFYRSGDWRSIFNHSILNKLKNKPGFACALDPVFRPGAYILEKINTTPKA